MKTYDLVAVGDVMVDVVAPALASSPRHAPIEIRAGGSAVNAARAAVAAGRVPLVVGCVGDDGLGRFVAEELKAEGIDACLGVAAKARTGRVLFSGGAIVAERGANARFEPSHVPDVRARAVLVSGYQLLREDSGPGAAAALSIEALIGVDLGSAALVSAYGGEELRKLLSGVDVVIGDADAVAALGTIDGPLVVTTLGAEGARAGAHSARPPVVFDGELFGSGDAFAATFLLAVVEGASTTEALEEACTRGTAVGRDPLPPSRI